MTSLPTTEKGRRVDIRTRRILARDGSEVVALSVFCPLRHFSRPVDDCRQCPHCEEIVLDPTERDSQVRCKATSEDQRGPGPGQTRLPQAVLRTPVLQLMTRNVICIRADLTVNELIMTLFENGISGAPVVDARGKPVGVVSKTDLLRDSYERVELDEDNSRRHLASEGGSTSPVRVDALMTKSVCSLPEFATIAEAAALMALEGLRRIPILDSEDTVVGIICASDILSWLARQAGYVVPAKFPVRR